MNGYKRRAPFAYTAPATTTKEQLLAQRASANVAVATDERYEMKHGKVNCFIVQMWHLGRLSGRSGWPNQFDQFGQELSAVRFYKTEDPGVDAIFATTIATLLGFGFSGEDVVNILAGYAYDMTRKVTRDWDRGEAQNLAAAHAEAWRQRLTKQNQAVTGLNAGALRLISSYANPDQQSPGQQIGGVTGLLFDAGRAVTAFSAGSSSWWKTDSRTTVGPNGVTAQEKREPSNALSDLLGPRSSNDDFAGAQDGEQDVGEAPPGERDQNS